MAEIDKDKLDELGQVVGYGEPSEHKRKKVSIIKDKKQYTIRIPSTFAEILKINPDKDVFEFQLIPDEKDNDKFHLQGILIKEE